MIARLDWPFCGHIFFGNLAIFEVGWPYEFWVGHLVCFGLFMIVWLTFFSVAIVGRF